MAAATTYNLPHLKLGEKDMSESMRNAWQRATSSCVRGVKYFLGYPARKAAERKVLDEYIAQSAEGGVPFSALTSKQKQRLRRVFKRLKKQSEEEFKRTYTLDVDAALDRGVAGAVAEAEEAERQNPSVKQSCAPSPA
jgi:hypothetical protein